MLAIDASDAQMSCDLVGRIDKAFEAKDIFKSFLLSDFCDKFYNRW